MTNMTIRKHSFLLGAAVLLIVSACSTENSHSTAEAPHNSAEAPETIAEAEAQRPNFIIFTTDDMGYTDLGAFGGRDIPTPNIDELAIQGVRLTNFHVSVACSPTRSMLMSGTGNHEAGIGVQNARVNGPEFVGHPGYEGHITDRVLTLAERMRDGGYQTYLSGKWHLGSEVGVNTPYDRGFTRNFALMSGGSSDHFRPDHLEQMPYLLDGHMVDSLPDDFYSTNAYVDYLIEFIGEGDQDQPFFAWFSPTSPHWPLQVYPGWEDKFVGQYEAGYDALCLERQQGAAQMSVLAANADTSVCPEEAPAWDTLSDEDKQLNSRTMELYAAMTSHLDTEFGRLIDFLTESGQLDNTYIIYHNDNGPQGGDIYNNRGDHDRYDNSLENIGQRNSWVHLGQGWSDAQSAPFREDKGSQFEGGIRVPAFIRSPNSAETGRTSNSLLTVMDVMPTIMDLAGVAEVNVNATGQEVLPIRGKSFAGLIDDPEFKPHEDEYIALDEAGESILFHGDWKIIRQPFAENWELYSLSANPNENKDVGDQHPELVAELAEQFEAHAQATGILRRDPARPSGMGGMAAP